MAGWIDRCDLSASTAANRAYVAGSLATNVHHGLRRLREVTVTVPIAAPIALLLLSSVSVRQDLNIKLFSHRGR